MLVVSFSYICSVKLYSERHAFDHRHVISVPFVVASGVVSQFMCVHCVVMTCLNDKIKAPARTYSIINNV